MKLAVFDFDSTLMDGETIDIIAQEFGIGKKISKITESAMRGEIDFFQSLRQRVRLLEGYKYNEVKEICHNLPYMQGAKEVISELKNQGMSVVCFSGGFTTATSYAKDILGYDADFSNVLHHKDGVLSGLVGGDMMFGFSKGDMLLRLQNLLHVSPKETLVVGDGANDLSMFAHASTRIAFCAKEVLKKEASHIIDEKDLSQVLKIIQTS